jgi:dTDP-4-dehydrorhamnose reductase
VTILVTGGAGQVATALGAAARARGLPVRLVGRPGFDFDAPDTLARAFDAPPSLVVNAAAYTAVDAAEANREAAWRANADGPARLAALCAEHGAPLIHISTDYVYDGDKGAPYVETDATDPQGVYGATKLEGEQAALAAWARTTVLRTSWVYAPAGRNFVLTMLGLAAKTDTLRVVADQKGCPTTAQDLAEAILVVADRIAEGWRDEHAGVFHAAGSGWTTWHGLAEAAFAEAARHGLRAPTVEAIATSDWPTPAKRPADSRLDCGKLARTFDVRLPDWRGSLARTVDAICAARGPAS